MSLVSIYVQSQDGEWYKDPMIRQEGWFICWDDDEPIELVVRYDKDHKEIIEYLNQQGWSVAIDHENECCGHRIFDYDERGFEEACSFFLRQNNGPPGSLLPGDFRVKFDPLNEPVPSVLYPNNVIEAHHHDLKDELGMYEDF